MFMSSDFVIFLLENEPKKMITYVEDLCTKMFIIIHNSVKFRRKVLKY